MFVSNKPMSMLLILGVFVGGAMSFMGTSKQLNPEINIPQFAVTVQYADTTAQEAEEFITKLLEESMASMDGVDAITSTTVDGAQSTVVVLFKNTVLKSTAKVRIRSKVDDITPDIRKFGASDPTLTEVTADYLPVSIMAFRSNTLNQDELRLKIINIKNELRSIDGIFNLDVKGGQPTSMRITLDPAKMQQRSVSVKDVENAITKSNIKQKTGVLQTGEQIFDIEVNGLLVQKKDAKKIYVAPGVKLGDIATIQISEKEKTEFVQLYQDGFLSDAVFLSFGKREKGNAIDVITLVLEEIPHILAKEEYKDLHIFQNGTKYLLIQNDQVATLTKMKSVGISLLQSIVIVFVVLLIFMSARAAFNVAIAIPMVVMAVFIVGEMMGVVISTVAFYGLMLAIGLLVDASTVMVQASYDEIQKSEPGRSKIDCVVQAARNNAFGLLLSTLTSVIVFIPLMKVSGATGQFLLPIGVYVPVALICAVFLTLTAIAFLSTILLKKDTSGKESAATRFMNKISVAYSKKVKYLLAKRSRQISYLLFVLVLFIGAMAVNALGFVKQGGMSASAAENFNIMVNAPENTDLLETQKITEHITRLVSEDENVILAQIFTGTPPIESLEYNSKGGKGRSNPYQSTIRFKIPNEANREKKDQEIIDDAKKRLFEDEMVQKYFNDGFRFRVFGESGGLNGVGKIAFQVRGPDNAVRHKVAKDVEQMFRDTNGIVHVDTDIDQGTPRIIYRIDQEKALQTGVTTEDAKKALSAALGPMDISQYHTPFAKEYASIYLQFDSKDRRSLSDLSKIYVKSTSGEMIPLDSVVTKIETRNSPKISRDDYKKRDFQRVDRVYGEDYLVDSTISMNTLTEKIDAYEFPEGGKMVFKDKYGWDYVLENGEKYSIRWEGSNRGTLDAMGDLVSAFVVSFFLVYLILVLQYSSFLMPVVVMTTIPLGFIGIYPGFAVTQMFFPTIVMDPPSMIGFIALLGIVVNNSIMILEYFDIQREKGLSIPDALVESCRIRMTPILLTTATTTLGTATLLSQDGWAGLSLSIMFGLMASVTLTLFLIPSLYMLLFGYRKPKRGESLSS